MRKTHEHALPHASFHVEGGGPRERWRIENSFSHESELHGCAQGCSVVPISRTQRLSPTAYAVPPLSEKEGFASLHCCANLLDLHACAYVVLSYQLAGPDGYHPPQAIPPFWERGLFSSFFHFPSI